MLLKVTQKLCFFAPKSYYTDRKFYLLKFALFLISTHKGATMQENKISKEQAMSFIAMDFPLQSDSDEEIAMQAAARLEFDEIIDFSNGESNDSNA